jgi:two-component system chemotaxis response regulator CheY
MRTGLIVDDATVMRIRLREILEHRYRVIAEATNGQEALKLYAQHNPDFVTLDITMPQLNGLEALGILVESHPEAKVVIVSAVGQKKMVFEAISKGAKDFIIKPFDPERVLISIDRLFA